MTTEELVDALGDLPLSQAKVEVVIAFDDRSVQSQPVTRFYRVDGIGKTNGVTVIRLGREVWP